MAKLLRLPEPKLVQQLARIEQWLEGDCDCSFVVVTATWFPGPDGCREHGSARVVPSEPGLR